jgi:electron transport complex protein RnfG
MSHHIEQKDSIIKTALNLCMIGFFAGIILATANFFTEPMRKANEVKTKENAKKEILKDAVVFESVSNTGTKEEIFVGKNATGNIVGYIVPTAPKGFDGHIEMLLGATSEFKVIDYKILKDKETPGLGSKAKELYFRTRFKDRTADQIIITKVANGKDIEAITGATITSKAIATGVKNGLEQLKANVLGEVQK